MTNEDTHAFAAKHAPELSKDITRLRGSAITKGLTGILVEVLEMHQQAEAVAAELAELKRTTCNCRFEGNTAVELCTLHEAWRDTELLKMLRSKQQLPADIYSVPLLVAVAAVRHAALKEAMDVLRSVATGEGQNTLTRGALHYGIQRIKEL